MICCAVGDLRHDVLELREEQRGDVEFARFEPRQDVPRDILRVAIADALDLAQVDMADEEIAVVAPQLFAALLAHGEDLHGLALGVKRTDLSAVQGARCSS